MLNVTLIYTFTFFKFHLKKTKTLYVKYVNVIWPTDYKPNKYTKSLIQMSLHHNSRSEHSI